MALIKRESYGYLITLSENGEVLKSSTERISGFIERLEKYDADFKKIKPSIRKTTYAFNEAIRIHLKNQITKINKELDEADLVD